MPKIVFSSSAALGYAKLGGDIKDIEIDDSDNPFTCPVCGIVKPKRDGNAIVCADDGTVIAVEVEVDEEGNEGQLKTEGIDKARLEDFLARLEDFLARDQRT